MKSIILFSFVCTVYANKIPPTFKRCDVKKANFDECLTRAIPEAIRQLTKPLRQLGMPSMHPLVIPAMTIERGKGIDSFMQNYTNMKVWGFTNITCSKIHFDYETLDMKMQCSTPQIRVETNYAFNGSFSVMPLYGHGLGKIILDHLDCFHAYTFDEYRSRNGRRHLMVINSTFDTEPKHVRYRFDNLYEGDEELSRNVHLVMNDNWKEIYRIFEPVFEEGFRRVFKDLCDRVMSRVAVDDLFLHG